MGVAPNNQPTNSQALGVATGTNRLNSSGMSLGTVKSRTSLTYTNVIQPGQTLPIPAAGTQFYVVFATNAILIRPSGGVFTSYQQSTGLQLVEANAFELIEVQNNSGVVIVFQLFVGFDQYIDNRLTLNSTLTPSIVYPTYSAPNTAAAVAITDISGTAFTDINGGKWYAIQRLYILIFNPDTGVTLFLQQAGSGSASGPAIGVIYPQTSLNYPASGNYSLSVGGGNINAVVSEVYQSIAAT